MARRPLAVKPKPQYEYASMQECEESGVRLHRLETKQWPPKSLHGEPMPHAAGLCTRCGCNLIAYGHNDPEQSGLEVVVLEGRKAG